MSRFCFVVVFVLVFVLAPLVAAGDEAIVLPLKVEFGQYSAARDSRVFAVPVRCEVVSTYFTWGCTGWTMVSESFAKKCSLDIKPDRQTDHLLDAHGNPMFIGQARAEITLGDRRYPINVKVMRDSEQTKSMTGVIGYDLASKYQWELDPSKPELTLRALGAESSRTPLSVLPLRDENEQLWVSVKHNGKPAELLVAPQNSDTQAGPELQKLWSLGAEGRQNDAAIRTIILKKGQTLDLSEKLREAGVFIVLHGHPDKDDAPDTQNALGQSLLNRFVYSVDTQRKEMAIVARANPPKR